MAGPSHHTERGAATLLVTACLGVLLLVGCALAVVAAMVAGHRSAQAAADLAALAGATAARDGGDPCATAGSVAADNGARLTRCSTDGSEITVEVEVRGPRWLGQTHDLAAVARAGPADVPVGSGAGEAFRVTRTIRTGTGGFMRGLTGAVRQRPQTMLTLTACSGSDDEGGKSDDEPSLGSPTTSASVADDEAEIEETVAAYDRALVTVNREQEVTPQLTSWRRGRLRRPGGGGPARPCRASRTAR